MNDTTQTPPADGASRSEDFHPETRNPQSTDGVLQPNSSLQVTGDQGVLMSEGARLTVPSGSSELVERPVSVSAGGLSWFFVAAVTALLVGVVVLIVWRRAKLKLARPSSAPVQPGMSGLQSDASSSSNEQAAPDRKQALPRKSRRKQQRQ